MADAFRCFYCCCTHVDHNHKKPFDHVMDKKKRQCTDTLWLFIFVIFIAGLSNKELLVRGEGHDGEMIAHFPNSGMSLQSRPFAFALNSVRPNESIWVCVSQCPSEYFTNQKNLSNYLIAKNGSLCAYDFLQYEFADSALADVDECPAVPLFSSNVRLNRCVPNELANIPSKSASTWVDYILDNDFLRQLATDFRAGVYIYTFVCVVVICSCLLINYVLIWGNQILVYTVYVTALPFGIACSLILCSAFVCNFFGSLYLESSHLNLETKAERFINGFRTEHAMLLMFAVIFSLFTIASWVLTWTIFKPRSHLVSELFEQARKPTKCMLWLLPETLLNTLLSSCLFAMWFYILANLLSIREPRLTFLTTKLGSTRPIIEFGLQRWVKIALIFHFIGFVWIKAFLSDVQKFIIAHATATWYFGESEHRPYYGVYFRSLFFLLRYHLGSLALGSFMLIILRIPSHIYLFLYYRLVNVEHSLIKCFFDRFEWFLTKIERILCHVHSNAYAVVSTNGECFLRASRTAGNLWMDNSWYLLSTNTVASILFMLVKWMFFLAIAFITGFYFRMNSSIEYWIVPTLLCSALAYFIVDQFLSLHTMIIETMFLCYACEIDGLDSQRQDSPNAFHMKADYGFYCYMRRRIEDERRLNNSVTPFQRRKLLYLTTIGQPSPRAENGNTPFSNQILDSTPLISLSSFVRDNGLY
ncbi:plasma-membrane choline transporter domain-containing protein [Ditylenchus destructor]|uniref:Choline transporter-like protein n=1 Tax=Ditylenchus destructor TaxID=166010 RepID=A0AAD4MI00_9BILA|nr:plasma-membrane choline transporter domain-containing protein [Ditylenchus destructor]